MVVVVVVVGLVVFVELFIGYILVSTSSTHDINGTNRGTVDLL